MFDLSWSFFFPGGLTCARLILLCFVHVRFGVLAADAASHYGRIQVLVPPSVVTGG